MARLTPEQQIIKAERDLALARERLARANKAIREAERSADTRRKILVGAEILKRAESNPQMARFVRGFIAGLERPSDVAAFEGYDKLASDQAG